jgi:hypothetical protein
MYSGHIKQHIEAVYKYSSDLNNPEIVELLNREMSKEYSQGLELLKEGIEKRYGVSMLEPEEWGRIYQNKARELYNNILKGLEQRVDNFKGE